MMSNTRLIGKVIYTDYIFAFEIAGLILLVAIIAAIALTIREKKDNKRQNDQRAGQGARVGPRAHRQDEVGNGSARSRRPILRVTGNVGAGTVDNKG